jgi:hypothetical protein
MVEPQDTAIFLDEEGRITTPDKAVAGEVEHGGKRYIMAIDPADLAPAAQPPAPPPGRGTGRPARPPA